LKLLMLSDFHGHRPVIKEFCKIVDSEHIDSLIVCGDLTHFGSLKSAEEILKELVTLGTPLFFVPGNCDPKELAKIEVINGAVNLHGRCKKINGLNFIGVGGSVYSPFKTPFEFSEETLRETIDHAYRELNAEERFVLVSHMPPMNTKVDITASGIHVGSASLREFVEKARPILMACGHIHEARGIDELGGTLIVNSGSAHRGSYALVEVDGCPKAKLGSLW